jgi:Tol biopolymer transport system component
MAVLVLGLLAALALALPAHATFPGGNGLVVFDTNRTGDFEIFTMTLDGTDIVNLTNDPGLDDTNPFWDPGGNGIVFMSFPASGIPFIRTINADGTGLVTLTDHPSGDAFPTFCDPDSVIFSSARQGGDLDLFEIGIDGTGLRLVADLPGQQFQANCRPDGKRIVYTSTQDGNLEVYEINRDGTDPVNLTQDPAADLDPNYFPTGDELLFSSNRDGNPEVFRMNLGPGGGLVQVTHSTAPFEYFQPKALPDGGQFLATQFDGVQNDVVLGPLPAGAAAAPGSSDQGRSARGGAGPGPPDPDVVPLDDDGDGLSDESGPDDQPRVVCLVNLPGTVLSVKGTNGNDRINIVRSDGRVQVFMDGALICDLPLDGIRAIDVNTGPGDDQVTLDPTLGTTNVVQMEGGPGSDTLAVSVEEVVIGPIGVGREGGSQRGGMGGPAAAASKPGVEFFGGPGDDVLIGGSRDDLLVGGTGADRLVGKGGDDELNGGKGPDTMLGGGGNDLLLAKDGTPDVVKGGPGIDTAKRDKKDTVTGVEG